MTERLQPSLFLADKYNFWRHLFSSCGEISSKGVVNYFCTYNHSVVNLVLAYLWTSQLNKVTQDLSLICICKQKTFSPVLSITIQVKKTKLYLLKLPNRTSSPFSCILGTACLISCEISLFVTAGNRKGILLATCLSLASLAWRNWRWISE